MFFVAGYSQTQTKCFRNAGLKDEHRINLAIDGRKVSGEFMVARDYSEEQTQIYAFTGTITGGNLTVRFTPKVPDAFPPKRSTLAWRIVTKGDVQTLRLQLYGRKAGKYAAYTADYESCEPSYSTLRSSAKRVSFAKGSSSVSIPVTLNAMSERRSFLVNLRARQRLSITAVGCGISYFNPDKTPYDEGTAIDTWGSESLPQTGDYLFVISPAGVPGTCNVIFKTN